MCRLGALSCRGTGRNLSPLPGTPAPRPLVQTLAKQGVIIVLRIRTVLGSAADIVSAESSYQKWQDPVLSTLAVSF